MSSGFRRRLLFHWRRHVMPLALSWCRVVYWRALGMRIGSDVRLHRLRVTWPHRVWLGDRCSVEHHVYFNIAGGYRADGGVRLGEGCFVGSGCEFNITCSLTVGNNCLIASGTRFIDHDHGTAPDSYIKLQPEVEAPIVLADNVWLGANCIVLKGVTIGEGAIVAAGSVVTRSLAPMTVNAGVPARCVRVRAQSEDVPQSAREATDAARQALA